MTTRREKVLYLLSRLRRLLNKQLGLPANRQTAVLAEMLSQLKSASESALEHNYHISNAALSFIDATHLPTEEANDIFDYLLMKNLMSDCYQFFAARAAYEGLHRGFCKSHAETLKC